MVSRIAPCQGTVPAANTIMPRPAECDNAVATEGLGDVLVTSWAGLLRKTEEAGKGAEEQTGKVQPKGRVKPYERMSV